MERKPTRRRRWLRGGWLGTSWLLVSQGEASAEVCWLMSYWWRKTKFTVTHKRVTDRVCLIVIISLLS
jgi:hypothetical protein